ncbi:MAG: phosphatidylglycerophosphatase A [Ignavibacteria bacterium]|nr:phosphatidylglycerophosphatase A [Ignavibacteria bacterium]
MKLSLIEKIIGSGLLTGFSPFASGTVASFLALLIYLFVPGFSNPTLMMLLISFLLLIGVKLAVKFETIYGNDPKQFTLDEFIGSWISFLFLPKKLWIVIPAFLIWRMMDIYKPFPIKNLEKYKNGWGVILDDVLAGLFSFFVIQISLHFINRLF